MKKLLPVFLCAIAMFFTTNSMAAGSLSGNLGVQLTTGNGCQVTGGTQGGSTSDFGLINFGTHPALNNTINAQSASTTASPIQLNCTLATAYTITLNSGANASGNQRRLALAGAYINYNLYSDSANLVAWPVAGVSGVGTGNAVDFTVYGQVPPQTTPAAGTYTDTVTVTITW